MLARASDANTGTVPLWPAGSSAERVACGPHDWHVVRCGSANAPRALLIHGTGASSHSFGPLAHHLESSLQLLSVDLPGQGGTIVRGGARPSLPGFARSIGALLEKLDFAPAYAIAHSAGTAIALRMALTGEIAPERVFGINSALNPIPANSLWAPMARVLFTLPGTAGFFAWQGRMGGAMNLLRQTNSRVPPESIALYERLFSDSDHIRATIGMMANWDLGGLRDSFADIHCPVTLIAALDDTMVQADKSRAVAAMLGSGEFMPIETGGHLVHESRPEAVARLILERIAAEDRQ